MKALPLLALSLLSAAGCTWVSPTPEAKDVIVLDQARVSHCKQIGKTEVSVLDKLGFVERVDEDVEHDLAVLARNQGAKMGGDTVSPISPVKNGKQTFGVYRCVAGQPGDTAQPANEPDDTGTAKTIPYGGG